MKLRFTIKHISGGLKYGTGSLAFLHYQKTGICYLDRFIDKRQETRFRKAGTGWKPIEIKKL